MAALTMSGIVTTLCDHALPAAPDWVQLVPMGEIITRDGRQFLNDEPEAVLEAFEAGKIDLPIDYEHANDRPEAKNAGPVPAAGWIKELAARSDGIWGRVEWTDRARAMIAAREYRFLSPSLLLNKSTHRITRLKGAALVHNPALHITALASEEDTMTETETLLESLIKLLGLDKDTPPADILAAMEKRLAEGNKPDPEKYAPVEAMREALADRNRELATLREDRARRKVDGAFKAGYLTSAGRGWALELCMKDEASFDAFLASTTPAFAQLTRQLVPGGPPPGSRTDLGPDCTAEVALLSQQLGVAPGRFTRD
jgi:phage I-like protein